MSLFFPLSDLLLKRPANTETESELLSVCRQECAVYCVAGVGEKRVDGENPHGAGNHHHTSEPAGWNRFFWGKDKKVRTTDVFCFFLTFYSIFYCSVRELK